jgi:hypothetical protein
MLTLASVPHRPAIMNALGCLVGLPDGGWPETKQAWHRLLETLPARSERDFTADQLVARYLQVDATTQRYRWRAR